MKFAPMGTSAGPRSPPRLVAAFYGRPCTFADQAIKDLEVAPMAPPGSATRSTARGQIRWTNNRGPVNAIVTAIERRGAVSWLLPVCCPAAAQEGYWPDGGDPLGP